MLDSCKTARLSQPANESILISDPTKIDSQTQERILLAIKSIAHITRRIEMEKKENKCKNDQSKIEKKKEKNCNHSGRQQTLRRHKRIGFFAFLTVLA